jgi:hypothetical protein
LLFLLRPSTSVAHFVHQKKVHLSSKLNLDRHFLISAEQSAHAAGHSAHDLSPHELKVVIPSACIIVCSYLNFAIGGIVMHANRRSRILLILQTISAYHALLLLAFLDADFFLTHW